MNRQFVSGGGVAGPAWSSRRVVVVSIAGTWGLYLAFVATRLAIIGFPREWLLMERHALSACVGMSLTFVLYLLLRRIEHASIVLRIVAALLAAGPAAALLSFVNFEFLYMLSPHAIWEGLSPPTHFRGIFARTILEIYLVFLGWGTLYTSVSSALESQEAQRRAAVSQAETRDAQLRALRYQLNPHFIFNALNTVSALVLRGDTAGAENAIQGLSTFLHSALLPGALEDATLAEELELQRLYLDIEQIRFGDRLRVRWAIPQRLRSALLPPLLLQPLVENVIRHAVAPSRSLVTMDVGAFTHDDLLHVLVEDDGRGGSGSSGHGIGLSNAASRLDARYGAAAHCSYGPRPGGGYRVELVLPLRLRIEGV